MATAGDLVVRVLRQARAIGATETASAEDSDIALQAVRDAHGLLEVQGLLRWTMQDIPRQVELGYVLMAAYLVAPLFSLPADPAWMAQGMSVAQAYVHIPLTDAALCGAVDF